MTISNHSSKGINCSFVPVIFIEETNLPAGEIPSKHIKLNPVNIEIDAWEIAKTKCRSTPYSIGFTVREVHHDQ